ncbi:MAG TPA: Gfo/Idh/MocA family oxidoreductase [Pyrinomonadaceae bacterium]|nr:Gfo/Idh/MocA family oxidoreductase [Pyrinomonadaceae bacterium]
MTLRLALVGCGEHSKESHAAPLARYAAAHAGEITLVAACDLDLARAEDFCREFGFNRAYAGLDELLGNEQLDGCVTVMPVERIGEVAAVLLERRIPCVIEKPLGATLADVERLAQLTRDTGTPHMVSVNRRFMPYLNRAAAWARAAGDIQYVRATMVRHKRDEDDFIWSTAIHALDALRYLAGEIKDYRTAFHHPPGLSCVWYLISLNFESGAIGQIEVLPTGGVIEESYELFGENLRARVVAGSGPQRSIHCWRGRRLELEEFAREDEPDDLRNGSYQEVEEFIRALRTGTRPAPTVEDILPSSRICFRIAEEIALTGV